MTTPEPMSTMVLTRTSSTSHTSLRTVGET